MSTFSTSSRQKRLKTLSFLHFWLRNVLRATTACTFSTLFRHLNLQKWSEHGVFCTFWLQNVLRATTACTFSTSQLPKVVRDRQFLTLLTWKCASRHNGVHFFNISTSKSGPRMVCFVHFDFEMCFAPQRRALFRHLNFQKWSAPLVFWPFWLGNVLRATTARTFSCLIWPAGSAPAALASLLFDPPEPQIIGKTQWIATFLSFRASTSSFFWSFLFWLFSPLLFNCPYCRKFHFKLPSIRFIHYCSWNTTHIIILATFVDDHYFCLPHKYMNITSISYHSWLYFCGHIYWCGNQ